MIPTMTFWKKQNYGDGNDQHVLDFGDMRRGQKLEHREISGQ